MENVEDDKDLFKQLYEKTRILYNFTNLMNVQNKQSNYSELDPELTMVEVHTLVDILEHPGIRVADLGRMNKKTRGAVSQMVSKLEARGHIEKKASDIHGKYIELYLTKSGMKIAKEHEEYDVRAMTGTLNRLLETCSIAEINSFYKVISCYNEILQEEIQW